MSEELLKQSIKNRFLVRKYEDTGIKEGMRGGNNER